MLSRVVLNFILVIYSNASQLTYSLIGTLTMARRVLWIRSVCPSVWRFLEIGSLVFSGTQHDVRGLCGVVHNRTRLFENSALPPKWPSLGFLNVWENLIINFFSIWSIMKVYINCCMLEQILYLGKFWFLRYDPKCSWPIRLLIFKSNVSRAKWWKRLLF